MRSGAMVGALLATALLAAGARPGAAAEGRFHSAALGRDVALHVDLPASYDSQRRYPVLYLLHGLFESESFWHARGLASVFDRLVQAGQIPEQIVVAVDGGNSFFLNGPLGAYEDLVVRDLVAHMDATYRTHARRQDRALWGVSMGGYAALRIALAHPEVFGAVATHSAMLLREPPTVEAGAGRGQMEAFHRAFGRPFDRDLWHRNDPLQLALAATRAGLPALRFDCGRDDRYGLAAGNEELHRRLQARGVPHDFALPPGDHGYEYVRSVLEGSLRWLARRPLAPPR